MCNWNKWIWPGVVATVLLTTLAIMMKSETMQRYSANSTTHQLAAQYDRENPAIAAQMQGVFVGFHEGVVFEVPRSPTANGAELNAKS